MEPQVVTKIELKFFAGASLALTFVRMSGRSRGQSIRVIQQCPFSAPLLYCNPIHRYTLASKRMLVGIRHKVEFLRSWSHTIVSFNEGNLGFECVWSTKVIHRPSCATIRLNWVGKCSIIHLQPPSMMSISSPPVRGVLSYVWKPQTSFYRIRRGRICKTPAKSSREASSPHVVSRCDAG